MRVSAEPSDPGFLREGGATVYLDGNLINNVVTADEESGYVAYIDTEGAWSIVEKCGVVKIHLFDIDRDTA